MEQTQHRNQGTPQVQMYTSRNYIRNAGVGPLEAHPMIQVVMILTTPRMTQAGTQADLARGLEPQVMAEIRIETTIVGMAFRPSSPRTQR